MNPFVDIVLYITETLAGLYLGLVLLRFFLQLARADFYNPLSQGIVKITNPVLIPLRKVVPGIMGIDLASIVLALLIQLIVGQLNFFLVTQQFYNPLSALLFGVLGTLKLCTYIGFGVIIVLVISSFVAPYSTHPIIMLSRQLLEPLMRPIQKLLPPMGGLDFSVFFIGMGIVILQKVLNATAISMSLSNTALTFLTIGF